MTSFSECHFYMKSMNDFHCKLFNSMTGISNISFGIQFQCATTLLVNSALVNSAPGSKPAASGVHWYAVVEQ